MFLSLVLFPLYALEICIRRLVDLLGCPLRPRFASGANRLVVITGCDSGIGLYTARFAHELGFTVFASVLDTKSAGALELQERAEFAQRMHVLRLDVTQPDSVAQTVQQVKKHLAANPELQFHALWNNAGVCVVGELDWITDAHMDAMIEVNFRGLVRMCRAFSELVLSSKARIVNIGSINGLYAIPAGVATYCGTKFGVNGFTESLRGELCKYGVSVSVLNLGDFAALTNIVRDQPARMELMKQRFSAWQRDFYGDYPDRFSQCAERNTGFASPTQLDDCILRHHMRRMLLDRYPPAELLSASLPQVLSYFFYAQLPVFVQNAFSTMVIRLCLKKL